jgi:hypothetical protein
MRSQLRHIVNCIDRVPFCGTIQSYTAEIYSHGDYGGMSHAYVGML